MDIVKTLRILALTLLLSSSAFSDEAWDELADSDARLAELEASVAELKHWRYHHTRPNAKHASADAGYSFLFAKLNFHESFQAMSQNNSTGTLHLIPFENSFELTPRVWLGLKSAKGLGVRTTYWNFDHAGDSLTLTNDGINVPSAVSTTVIFPATITTALPGDVLNVTSSMLASTVDLEGTKDFSLSGLEATLAGGIRYAKAEQRYDAVVSGGPVPNIVPASLSTLRRFEGLGPTASAMAKLPWRNTGLYATGSARVSFLFGQKTLDRSVLNDVANTSPPFVSLDDADEVAGIYSVTVGAGWQKSWKRGNFFIEGQYEGQLWTTGGAPTLTFSGYEGFSLNLGLTTFLDR